MKRNKAQIFLTGSLILLFVLTSCSRQNGVKETKNATLFSNDQMIMEFSPITFLPKDTAIVLIPGKNQNWIVGDFDGDSLGEILFAYQFTTTAPDNPLMGAMLIKQQDGVWVKKYEYREKASRLYLAEAYDITGDNQSDLILGWENSQNYNNKQIYLYRWNKTDLESLGNFVCSKLDIADIDGIYGTDQQFELGIWTENDATLSIDILRWNAYTTLPILFPTEYGKSYTENKLSRAEDLEVSYFKNFVIPGLLTLEKEYPNEAKYDFSLIEAFIKAHLFEGARQKIVTSEGTLYQSDYEKIPFLLAQISFLQGDVLQGNQILQKELSKKISRVDAGYTLQLLGRTYVKAKEWNKAILAYNNALTFHRAIPDTIGYDSENQFQFSLAKDKARVEVLKHFNDLITSQSDDNYRNYFQNHITSLNKSKNIPVVHCSEFYLSLNDYSDPYGTIISWEKSGKKESILFMSIDEDQHKFKINYAPTVLNNEKTRNGWKLTITCEEKNPNKTINSQYKKIFLWENNDWKLLTFPE